MSKPKFKTQNLNLFEIIREQVKMIPKGKVATYGQISQVVNSLSPSIRISPQLVGWALHANKDPEVPCHRAVNKEGRLAPNFAFDGADEQRRRLVAEGVLFKDKMHVDLGKYGYLLE